MVEPLLRQGNAEEMTNARWRMAEQCPRKPRGYRGLRDPHGFFAVFGGKVTGIA
jgi:hypothetical protein